VLSGSARQCPVPGGSGTIPAAPAAGAFHRGAFSRHQFAFSGQGPEYFRIWIVNLLLSIVTIGFYSPWAKVRRMQYFYRHTSLAGASFNYHGDPITIFKGRIVALFLLGFYNISFKISPLLGVVAVIALGAIFPWLLWRSLRFRLHNTSYRGLRFDFPGELAGAYRVFLLWPLLTLISVYALAPVCHQRIKSYQHNASAYGRTRFSFDATTGQFYRVYLMTSALALGLLLLLGLVGVALAALFGGLDHFSPRIVLGVKPGLLMGMMVLVPIALYLGIGGVLLPYFRARIANLVWNRTRLGEHRFEYALSARRLALITLTNLLGVIFTLGLYMPFAQIRMTRYRVDCLALLAAGSLEEFAAGEAQAVDAAGEEVAEFFDIDIAL